VIAGEVPEGAEQTQVFVDATGTRDASAIDRMVRRPRRAHSLGQGLGATGCLRSVTGETVRPALCFDSAERTGLPDRGEILERSLRHSLSDQVECAEAPGISSLRLLPKEGGDVLSLLAVQTGDDVVARERIDVSAVRIACLDLSQCLGEADGEHPDPFREVGERLLAGRPLGEVADVGDVGFRE
jgi:hypothetical protein